MSADANERPSAVGDQIAAIIYLSGDRRGATEVLGRTPRSIRRVGRSAIRIEPADRSIDPDIVAVLRPSAETFELEVLPDRDVWVNGAHATTRLLVSGDVLEIGRNGPTLRFRQYPDGVIPRRTTHDVYCDCVDCARFGHGTLARKTGVFVGGVTEEFLNRTTLPFRIGVLVTLAVLIAVFVLLVRQNIALDQRIARGEAEMVSLSKLIERTESTAISRDDLVAMRTELEGDITTAVERVEALELRSGAAARVISIASQAVVFIQGAYGFRHPESGLVLRYGVSGATDSRLSALQGGRAVTLGGDGPPVELPYTGTGFFATKDGLLITSRHLARPWQDEDFAAVAATMGLVPFIQRFIGYLPGDPEPFDLRLVNASEDADVAILRRSDLNRPVPFIQLASSAPEPGDGVIVLGYPTGVRAMLARTDQRFLDGLQAKQELDFWSLGRELAQSGHIRPLATRGIVGQVTPSVIVYDAETAQGGSGGPVMNLDGAVIAVNTAILKEFGGSNLGVPIERAYALVEQARTDR